MTGRSCSTISESPTLRRFGWLSVQNPAWGGQFNAVENFFSKMTRQRIRRGVLRSIADLQAAIKAYLVEHASALSQTDGTGQRSSFARMVSADLVQAKGIHQPTDIDGFLLSRE
jgi:hypothetical protein